jgi:hypothetical protein
MRRKQAKGIKMDNIVDDLAGLGLNLDNSAAVEQVAPPSAESGDAQVAKTRAPRTEVKLAEIIVEEGFELTPITRGGGFGGGSRESKYKFGDMKAPVNVGTEKEPKWTYSRQVIVGAEGEDAAKVASSVRAAVASQNAKHKQAGETIRYLSRSGENGKVLVFRVDDTISED